MGSRRGGGSWTHAFSPSALAQKGTLSARDGGEHPQRSVPSNTVLSRPGQHGRHGRDRRCQGRDQDQATAEGRVGSAGSSHLAAAHSAGPRGRAPGLRGLLTTGAQVARVSRFHPGTCPLGTTTCSPDRRAVTWGPRAGHSGGSALRTQHAPEGGKAASCWLPPPAPASQPPQHPTGNPFPPHVTRAQRRRTAHGAVAATGSQAWLRRGTQERPRNQGGRPVLLHGR